MDNNGCHLRDPRRRWRKRGQVISRTVIWISEEVVTVSEPQSKGGGQVSEGVAWRVRTFHKGKMH
jgi:hypothetical protein